MERTSPVPVMLPIAVATVPILVPVAAFPVAAIALAPIAIPVSVFFTIAIAIAVFAVAPAAAVSVAHRCGRCAAALAAGSLSEVQKEHSASWFALRLAGGQAVAAPVLRTRLPRSNLLPVAAAQVAGALQHNKSRCANPSEAALLALRLAG